MANLLPFFLIQHIFFHFDQRIINFVLSIPEKFENKKKDGVSNSNVVQPRMLDKFFAIISTIKDWEKNLSKVIQIGDLSIGC